LLLAALGDAAAAGYDVASFSGGEPTLYPGLGALLEHARSLGMRTTVTTHGMLLGGRRLEALRGRVDVLAISLDGEPDSHDRMRGRGAFESMAANLEGVRTAAIPFGFVFTLTQHNLDELSWVAQFAVDQGASLLHIHPLEEVGRAAERLAGRTPDAIESAFAVWATDQLREAVGDRLQIQLDLADSEQLRNQPARVFATQGRTDDDRPLADLVSPLVIEADGMVVPIQHGFDRRYALGNMYDRPLRELMEGWRHDSLADFSALCRAVFDEVIVPAESPLVNWYDVLGRRAAKASR
jgi:MoaA/NifB/PqqE/SkfB family radical SAM enzyme